MGCGTVIIKCYLAGFERAASAEPVSFRARRSSSSNCPQSAGSEAGVEGMSGIAHTKSN